MANTKNGASIQAEIERALSKALKSKIKLIGSGRTDAGVNAWGQSANFKVNNEIKNIFKILTTVNFYLNKHSISVIKLKKKNLNFHARHSAKKENTNILFLIVNLNWLSIRIEFG